MFPNVVTHLAGEEPVVSSFLGFVEANREDPDLLVGILATLARGEEFCGDGGAEGTFTVRLANAADGLPALPDSIHGMHELLGGAARTSSPASATRSSAASI